MQLSKGQVRNNLLRLISKIVPNFEDKNYLFKIKPVLERNVTYNSYDDYIMRGLFDRADLNNRYFSLDEAINFLIPPHGKYPFWIEVIFHEELEGQNIIELKTSMRYRTPSQLKYLNNGYPPFFTESIK